MSTSSETLTRPDGSPVRVLVVDDEQMLADLLASALRYEGWEVTTAGTGVAAVRAAREIEPDVVVLDLMLPESTAASRTCPSCSSRPRTRWRTASPG